MNISRATILFVASMAILPAGAFAHCGGKHTGNHPHCSDDGGGDDGGGDGGGGEYTGSPGVDFITPSDVPGFDYHIVGTSNGDSITAGGGADLVEGGAGGDSINGLGGNDEIRGQDGDDFVDAGEGNDTISLGAGDDGLFVGPGIDAVDGGDGVDVLDCRNADQISIDMTLGTYNGTITDSSGAQVPMSGSIVNVEDIWGTNGDDVLYGSDLADNAIYGAEGDDIIHGLGGNDNLIGGQGNDVVRGGPGNDVVGGEPGADLVYGDDGDDVVSGAESGAGDLTDDQLWGGAGTDVFHFRREFGTDTIMDYEQDELIDLSDYKQGFWRNDLRYDVIDIDTVGSDIVIDFWLKRGGGTGGTIILKNAAANGITVDETDFIIE